jgi:hypothetical protein
MVPALPISTSGVPEEGPSGMILAKCFEIRSTVLWIAEHLGGPVIEKFSYLFPRV